VAVRAVGDYIRPYVGGMSEGHFRVGGGVAFRIGSR